MSHSALNIVRLLPLRQGEVDFGAERAATGK